MFVEVDALPGAEIESTIEYRDREGHSAEHRADVRGHVVVALGVVLETRIAVRNEASEVPLEVAPDRWIGVLAQDEGSAGVMQEHECDTVRYSASSNARSDFSSQVLETAT